MQKLTSHIVEGDTAPQVDITVFDEPGQGGAHHEYSISYATGNASDGMPEGDIVIISFQNGPIKEVSLNGISHEALMAILIHRFECFQNGPYACADNADVLYHLRQSFLSMKNRTVQRIARGVEGTNQK